MKTSNTQLGPVQSAWIHSIKNNPFRQTKGILGKKTDGKGNYIACLMGEFHLTFCRVHSLPTPFDTNGHIRSISGDFKVLQEAKEYGFRDTFGTFRTPVKFRNTIHYSIVGMNDSGVSWYIIATIIENDPSNVFTKIV